MCFNGDLRAKPIKYTFEIVCVSVCVCLHRAKFKLTLQRIHYFFPFKCSRAWNQTGAIEYRIHALIQYRKLGY